MSKRKHYGLFTSNKKIILYAARKHRCHGNWVSSGCHLDGKSGKSRQPGNRCAGALRPFGRRFALTLCVPSRSVLFLFLTTIQGYCEFFKMDFWVEERPRSEEALAAGPPDQ
jgi:hypothetical protein